MHRGWLFSSVTGRSMATGRAGTAGRGGGESNGHCFPAAGPFCVDQVGEVAGMGIVTAEAGDFMFAGMEIMQVQAVVTKAGCIQSLTHRHQGASMAAEAELLQPGPEKIFMTGGVRGMANKAVIVKDRWMNAFLAGPVFMAFVTEAGTPFLDRSEPVIKLMVAVRQLMARGAAVAGQCAMHERSAQAALVALEAGLAVEGIDGCSRLRSSSDCLPVQAD